MNLHQIAGVADEEQKKKVLGAYISNFETYTRYSEVEDKSRKNHRHI